MLRFPLSTLFLRSSLYVLTDREVVVIQDWRNLSASIVQSPVLAFLQDLSVV